MLRADHPHALWLTDLYRVDESAQDAERVAGALARMSPDFVIHTGGIQLAATGRMDFMLAYGQRRAELGGPAPVEIYQILADDNFAIIYALYRSERDGKAWEAPGLGVWRFKDGMAVEHWELPDGEQWDAFYLDGQPADAARSAIDFWSGSGAGQ